MNPIMRMGFDALQNICFCLQEPDVYTFLTCCRVLLHEAPCLVRVGIVRVERFHAALEKFLKLKNLVPEQPRSPPRLAELPSVRQRRAPVRLFDELESARLLQVARQQRLRPRDPEGVLPSPRSPKIKKRI